MNVTIGIALLAERSLVGHGAEQPVH